MSNHRNFIFGIIATLGFSVAAHAGCPELTGVYNCPAWELGDAVDINLSQAPHEGGGTRYQLDIGSDSAILITDGVERELIYEDNVHFFQTSVCTDDNMVLEKIRFTVNDEEFKAATTYGLDSNNNLVIEFKSNANPQSMKRVCTHQ